MHKASPCKPPPKSFTKCHFALHPAFANACRAGDEAVDDSHHHRSHQSTRVPFDVMQLRPHALRQTVERTDAQTRFRHQIARGRESHYR